jgi:hypothetical protein
VQAGFQRAISAHSAEDAAPAVGVVVAKSKPTTFAGSPR